MKKENYKNQEDNKEKKIIMNKNQKIQKKKLKITKMIKMLKIILTGQRKSNRRTKE